MRRLGVLAAALAVCAARGETQQPTRSRALEGALRLDSAPAVWFFGTPDTPLETVAAAVRTVGGRVRRRSVWLHAVSATADAGAVERALRRVEFRHLQPVARRRGVPEPAEPWAAPLAAPGDSLVGPGVMPFRVLNILPLVGRGLRGAGVTIAILDTGFETELAAFDSATVAGQYDFVFNDSVVRNEAQDHVTASQHGTETWSLLGANISNVLVGVAPDAAYLLAKTEDVRSETRVEEDNWVAAVEWADSLGADIITSSLGYLSFQDGFAYTPADLNGDVAITTIMADLAAARGIVVVTSAGNEGPGFRTLTTPADGDTVLAAGAVDSLGRLAPFSSRGPTADGRLKPDLVAPGVSVFVVNPLSGTGYSRVDGTSFAAPLLAGIAALYREEHPLHAPLEVITALKGAADRRASPDSAFGWGIPHAARAVSFPRGIRVVLPLDSVVPSVTPTVQWVVPEVAQSALPLTYRLIVARDALLADIVVDTTVPEPRVTLPAPLAGGTPLRISITVTAADAIRLVSVDPRTFVVPAWAALTTLDDPDGLTIREVRPTFRWTSPEVDDAYGPFTYDLRVIRVDDGDVELEERGLTAREFTPTRDLERNTPYRWLVVARLESDSAVVESRGTFLIIDDSTPSATLLFQNFPNPFPNPRTGQRTTCLWFDLSAGGRVTLDILDIRGHVLRNVVPGVDAFPTQLPAGRYGRPDVGAPGRCDPRLEWDGTADDGTPLPRGIYVARLVTPEGTFLKRIVFMGGDR